MLTISPSTIAYTQCALKFDRLVRQRKFARSGATSPVMRYATAVHSALRMLYDPALGTPAHTGQLDFALRTAFAGQPTYQSDEDRQYDIRRARRLLLRYLDEDEDDAPCTIAVERQCSYPVRVEGAVLFEATARLDRLLVRPSAPDTLVCRDYKVSSSRPLDIEAVWLNLASARAQFREAGYKHWTLEVENLTDDGTERCTYHSADLKGVVTLVVERVQRHLGATEVIPTPCEACHFCQVKPECPAHANAIVDVADMDF